MHGLIRVLNYSKVSVIRGILATPSIALSLLHRRNSMGNNLHSIGVNIAAFGRKITLFCAIPLSRFSLKMSRFFFAYFELEKMRSMRSAQRQVELRRLGNQLTVLGKANSLGKIVNKNVDCFAAATLFVPRRAPDNDIPVSRFECVSGLSVYWPIIALGTRECGVAKLCRDPTVQSEFFLRVSLLKTFNLIYYMVVSAIAVFILVDNNLSSSLHC